MEANITEFNVVGISVRTTNENGKSATDIGNLWARFISEALIDKIPNKVDNNIYCVYTEYEADHTKPYTVILGCRVNSANNIPDGMTLKTIQSGKYSRFIAKGSLTDGVVYEEWLNIWNTDLARLYSTDFEVYTEKAQDRSAAEVEIFVAVKG